MGYRVEDAVYKHPARQVVFLGDFIDRGPRQREVIDVVRPMIDSGNALAVMGNHEFNAIGYATSHAGTQESDAETWLRPRNEKNKCQHQKFLDEYPDSSEHLDLVNWFKRLPIWLDLGDLRVIHACWDDTEIAKLDPYLNQNCLPEIFGKGTELYHAHEVVLKGKEHALPTGHSFTDADGHNRTDFRVKWWLNNPATCRDWYLGAEESPSWLPDFSLGSQSNPGYPGDGKPIFFGHYWLQGVPKPMAANVACLDYSAVKPGGKLAAYRWDGNPNLNRSNFTWVDT